MLERFPAPPPAPVSRLLARFDRQTLEGFIAVAIDLLDFADGDPDLEDDDPDGSVEDDPCGFDPETDRDVSPPVWPADDDRAGAL